MKIKRVILRSEVNEEDLAIKGVAVTENDGRYPFELLLGTGRCIIAEEDFYALPEKEWREAMSDAMHEALREIREKDVYFDITHKK